MKRFSIISAFLILLLYGILLIAAIYFFSPSGFLVAIKSPRVLHSIFISLSAASIATVLAVAIAIPAAYALSRYRFFGRSVIDVFLEIPMIISPAALGALLLLFLQTPFGEYVSQWFNPIFTFWGIILAQFVTILGIATRMIKTTFDEIPIRYEMVSRTLGANTKQAFFTISLPLAKSGIASATILSWAKAVGEFGATITVAGSVAMKTETLPTAIYMNLANADIAGTVVIILILVMISLSMLLVTRLIFRQNWVY